MRNKKAKTYSLSNFAWDLWCLVSIVGIWPRFIEPNLIATTSLTLRNPNLPAELKGLRILQFSDLHIHPRLSNRFLNRLIRKILRLAPDMIVFTGDFICYSQLDEKDAGRLKHFLNQLKAPFGCYAVLGNHDYQEYISVDEKGDYDVTDPVSAIKKGFQRLFQPSVEPSKVVTDRALKTPFHQELMNLLKETPFEILHNSTTIVPIKGTYLNVCGLGEHMLGRSNPQEAFKGYDKNYPGIILTHNPDSVPYLKGYPGELVLCGHTHGGQVNLPGLNKKFTIMENKNLKKSLVRLDDRWVYVNRGVGSVMPFRWFASPEILLVTLEGLEEDDEESGDEA